MVGYRHHRVLVVGYRSHRFVVGYYRDHRGFVHRNHRGGNDRSDHLINQKPTLNRHTIGQTPITELTNRCGHNGIKERRGNSLTSTITYMKVDISSAYQNYTTESKQISNHRQGDHAQEPIKGCVLLEIETARMTDRPSSRGRFAVRRGQLSRNHIGHRQSIPKHQRMSPTSKYSLLSSSVPQAP